MATVKHTTNPSGRRSFLAGLAAAGALSAVPVAQALASPEHPDAALLALGPEIEAADLMEVQSIRDLSRLEEAYAAAAKPEKPEPPKDWTKEDIEVAVQELHRGRRDSLERRDEADRSYEEACRAWDDSRDRLWDEMGVSAAEDLNREASDAVDDLGDRVAAIRARTLAGLIFKAKYAVAHNESEADPRVVESIVEDLLAMAGESA